MKPFSKLRQLLEKSTPGEWSKEYLADTLGFSYRNNEELDIDSSFIAEAHNTLPKVLEALDVAIEFIISMKYTYGTSQDPEFKPALKALAKIKELAGE